MLNPECVILNLVQNLQGRLVSASNKSTCSETLKRVQCDRNILFQRSQKNIPCGHSKILSDLPGNARRYFFFISSRENNLFGR
jgi:hypothetical protein